MRGDRGARGREAGGLSGHRRAARRSLGPGAEVVADGPAGSGEYHRGSMTVAPGDHRRSVEPPVVDLDAGRPIGRTGRTGRLCRLVGTVALVGAVVFTAVAGAAPPRQGELAELAAAEAALDAAFERHAAAIGDRDAAEARAVTLEADLRALDDRSLQLVLEYEATVRRARDLAVEAYVRGGTTGELDGYLDAAGATEAAVRSHLAVGRVESARDAARAVRQLRQTVDTEAAATGEAVATAVAALDRSNEAVRAAAADIDAARGRVAAAEVAVAAAAEAERIAAAEAAEAARRAAEAAARAPSGGATGDAWARLRNCESGGDYTVVSSNGLYFGAYQFSLGAWAAVGGTGNPAAASPAEQDYRARLLFERAGWTQWPICGRYLVE